MVASLIFGAAMAGLALVDVLLIALDRGGRHCHHRAGLLSGEATCKRTPRADTA